MILLPTTKRELRVLRAEMRLIMLRIRKAKYHKVVNVKKIMKYLQSTWNRKVCSKVELLDFFLEREIANK